MKAKKGNKMPVSDGYKMVRVAWRFMPVDCGARVRQAHAEFKAELSRMGKEGEHAE